MADLLSDTVDISQAAILHVEDDPASRYAVGRVLYREGFTVSEAATGMEGLRLVKEGPDLVILDVQLPDLDGFEVCRRIKANPATATIPVLHLSASYVTTKDQVSGLEGGADAYLVQPVDPGVLVATVKALLRMRRAEEKYRSIFENAVEGIFQTTFEGRVVAANPMLARIFGYDSPEEITAAVTDFSSHLYADPAQGNEVMRLLQEQGTLSGFEVLGRCKGGSGIWVSINVRTIRDRNGRPVGFEGTVEDITERKKAEEALRKSEQRLQRVLETDAVGVIFFDHEGTVVDANDVFLAMTGYTRTEVSARELTWRRMTPPEWVRDSEKQMERLAATGRIGPYEKEYFLADGSRRWMLFAGRDLGDGTICEYCIDITEGKQAEESLRESEEQLRLAVEAADLGRWELVPETGEFHTSATCNRHLGLPADARPTYEGHFETIHHDDHEMIYDRLRRAVEESREFEAEYRVARPDGATFASSSPAGACCASHGSAPDRLIGVTLDVTEARDLEKEKANSRARELTMLAETAERERISRELHDRVAHHMGVAHQSLELHAALRKSAPERAQRSWSLPGSPRGEPSTRPAPSRRS